MDVKIKVNNQEIKYLQKFQIFYFKPPFEKESINYQVKYVEHSKV